MFPDQVIVGGVGSGIVLKFKKPTLFQYCSVPIYKTPVIVL
jgi:hypothetical protein